MIFYCSILISVSILVGVSVHSRDSNRMISGRITDYKESTPLDEVTVYIKGAGKNAGSVIIEGKVYMENTTTPVANVYLYIIEGIEEGLTDKNGYFKIETWQKLPLDLTIKYKNNLPFKVRVYDISKK